MDVVGIRYFSLLSHCLDECQADESVGVVARLLEHQATFLERCFKNNWLPHTWGSTLLHSPNLLCSSPFQKAGLRFVGQLKKNYINNNVTKLLLHLYPQKIIVYLTDIAINGKVRGELAKMLVQHPNLTPDQVRILIDCLADITIDNPIRGQLAAVLVKRSDLIADQFPNLIRCLVDAGIGGSACEELAQVLIQNPNLRIEQILPLIIYLMDASIGSGILGKLVQRPDLTANQVQYFINCLTDTTIKDPIRRCIAAELAKRPEFTEEQIQFLINLLQDTTVDSYVRGYLAIGLVYHPDLTAEEIQSIFASLADMTIDIYIRGELATGLAQRASLTEEQIQSLIEHLLNTTIKYDVLRALAEAVVACSSLIPEQVHNLIDCLMDTTINLQVRGYLAIALTRRLNLLSSQMQPIFYCLTDTSMDGRVRTELAIAVAKRSELISEQFHNLITCLTDTTIDGRIRGKLAKVLAKCQNLTAEEIQSLIDCLLDTTINSWVRTALAIVLAQHPNLTEEQFHNLISCVKDTTIDYWPRRELAKVFAQSPNLTIAQIQSLLNCLEDVTIDGNIRTVLATALAKCPELTEEQIQHLVMDTTIIGRVRAALAAALVGRPKFIEEQIQHLLMDTTINGEIRAELATVLAGRSEFIEAQIQHLLADTTINDWIRAGLAIAVAGRLDLTAGQVQLLFACLANKVIASHARRELGDKLAQSFAQRLNLDVAQSQQLLAYSLKEKIICKKYPDLIFQILLVYYSNNQIQSQASSKLCIFLVSPSAWITLLRQQALLAYDKLNCTMQLRLQGQMIKFSIKKKFFNHFFMLTGKTWGGNLYQDVLNDKKNKLSLLNLIAKKNKSQVSTEQPPSVRYFTDENTRINQLNSIREKKGSVGLRQEHSEIEDFRQKAKPVIITTSTTTMPSLTVTSVVPVHHKPYETTVLPDTGNTLWADINVPADNTCLFYAVTLGALLPALEEMGEFARCFRALFGENKDDEAISQLQNCLKSFDGTDDFIQHHSAPLEVLVNVALRQRVVHVMRQNPAAYQEKLALEFATRDVGLLTEDDYEDYLQKMETPKGSWGGLIEVGVMSQLLNIPILTYEQEGLSFVCKDVSSNSQGRVIRIALTKASLLATYNNHFHVLLKPKHILLKTNKIVSHSDNKPLGSNLLPPQNTFFSRHHSHTAISKPQGLAKSEEAPQLTRKTTKSLGDEKETCKR